MNLKLKILLLSLMGYSNFLTAQTCNPTILSTTPDNQFIDNLDGTVTDISTGLIWMRCSLGQSWDGTTCEGIATAYSWKDALFNADQSNFADKTWQLPNIKELQNIVEESCTAPSVNLTIFPNTMIDKYWSSTPKGNSESSVWLVPFTTGISAGGSKNIPYFVRLVSHQ